MHRGERLIKLGDSWFPAKSIDVKPFVINLWCRALNRYGGFITLPNLRKLRKHNKIKNRYKRVSPWVRRSRDKRETAQIVKQGPQEKNK